MPFGRYRYPKFYFTIFPINAITEVFKMWNNLALYATFLFKFRKITLVQFAF